MALVDDYDVVVIGVAQIIDRYRDRVVVAEIDTNKPVEDNVDIVLYDCFAQPESDHDEIAALSREPARAPGGGLHLELPPRPGRERTRQGVHGYLSKALPARDLVAALEAVHAGEVVISDPPAGPAAPAVSTGPAAARA